MYLVGEVVKRCGAVRIEVAHARGVEAPDK